MPVKLKICFFAYNTRMYVRFVVIYVGFSGSEKT